MNSLKIFTDGGARGNPGPAAIGVLIKSENGQILKTLSRTIGRTTNNVAEYTAVADALVWLKESLKEHSDSCAVQFFLDSALVVNQLNGLFKVKNSELRNLLIVIRQLEQEVGGNISYTQIPREKNTAADLLVNQALDGQIIRR